MINFPCLFPSRTLHPTDPMKFLVRSTTLLLGVAAAVLSAQTTRDAVVARIDETKAAFETTALKIWGFAEVGYKEKQSSALLQEQLKAAGFTVETGVAGIPTAFTATFGSGSPVIGILGEYDALPGFSQDASPEKKPVDGLSAGHACGHHLFGTASAQAAVAVKEWMQATGQKGTIRFYGTPAEEGGSGKVYMVKAGLFDDVAAVLHWHPDSLNAVTMAPSQANKNGKFRFHGIASHAAGSPELGRSALDAVNAMNHMVDMMREHVPQETRLHYIITRGGDAPNVVPAFAESYHYVRHRDPDQVRSIWERLVKTAEGAALGTGTTVSWEVLGGVYDLLPNEVLGRTMHANLTQVGGVTYNEAEREFAQKIGRTLFGQPLAPELAALIQPFNANEPPQMGSTDVGDVSWNVPTMGISTATWVPGTPAHSWQAVASGGTTIGLKGMNVAAKVLALTCLDLFTQPQLLLDARAEFDKRRGPNFKYAPLLGNRGPALNYRD